MAAPDHEMCEIEQDGARWRTSCSCGWRSADLADEGEVRFAWEEHTGQDVNG